MEAVLKRYQQPVLEAVDKAERKVRVGSLVDSCEEAMTKAIGKQEQIYSSPDRTRDPEALKIDLERWLSDVTVENNNFLKRARDYINGFRQTEKPVSFPLKSLSKPSLLLRLPKRLIPEFPRHPASDNKNLFLA